MGVVDLSARTMGLPPRRSADRADVLLAGDVLVAAKLIGWTRGARAVAKRLEAPLMAAALLTIPALIIDGSTADRTWIDVATVLNWTIWTAFVAEILIMVRVSPSGWGWLRERPLDVAIVLLTPPFLPATLQAARVFRLLRLLRLFKLAGLTRTLMSTEGVRDTGLLVMLTVLGGGAAFAAVEQGHQSHHLTTWDGVWWAVTTVTTVGYGDLAPQTTGGRAIAIIIMFVGIEFVAILTAAAADRFLRAQRAEAGELDSVEAKLDEILRRLEAIERG